MARFSRLIAALSFALLIASQATVAQDLVIQGPGSVILPMKNAQPYSMTKEMNVAFNLAGFFIDMGSVPSNKTFVCNYITITSRGKEPELNFFSTKVTLGYGGAKMGQFACTREKDELAAFESWAVYSSLTMSRSTLMNLEGQVILEIYRKIASGDGVRFEATLSGYLVDK